MDPKDPTIPSSAPVYQSPASNAASPPQNAAPPSSNVSSTASNAAPEPPPPLKAAVPPSHSPIQPEMPVQPQPPVDPYAQPVGEPYAPPTPLDYPASDAPIVVVPDTSAGLPKWFPIVFGITILIFFAITTLLVMSMLQKPASSPAVVPIIPTTAVMPTTVPPISPLPSVVEATGSSDEVEALDADVQQVDFTDLDETLIP